MIMGQVSSYVTEVSVANARDHQWSDVGNVLGAPDGNTAACDTADHGKPDSLRLLFGDLALPSDASISYAVLELPIADAQDGGGDVQVLAECGMQALGGLWGLGNSPQTLMLVFSPLTAEDIAAGVKISWFSQSLESYGWRIDGAKLTVHYTSP